jgi:hypothetical protein
MIISKFILEAIDVGSKWRDPIAVEHVVNCVNFPAGHVRWRKINTFLRFIICHKAPQR